MKYAMRYVKELDRHGIAHWPNAGKSYVQVCCPFHRDNHPSAEVRKHDGRFYCFHCKIWRSFPEYLAQVKGITLEEAERMCTGDESPSEALNVLDTFLTSSSDDTPGELRFFSVNSFHDIYPSVLGTQGQEYLMGRGLTRKTMRDFDVRWCDTPGVWENRVIFPIYTDAGKLLAWCGRAVDNRVPKTRKNVSARDTLYGIHRLVGKRKSKLPYLILVEGEIDALWMQQCGYFAVSTMGTSRITVGQAKQVLKYTKKVITSFDPDEAGLRATEAGITYLKTMLPTYCVKLPDGKDPNDCSKVELDRIFSGRL